MSTASRLLFASLSLAAFSFAVFLQCGGDSVTTNPLVETPCGSNGDCKSGVCENLTTASGCGVCAQGVEIGGTCTTNGSLTCGAGLTCVSSLNPDGITYSYACWPVHQSGESCSPDPSCGNDATALSCISCATGTYCESTTSTCEPLGTAATSAPCTTDDECITGDYCDTSNGGGRCTLGKSLGEPCTENCGTGLYCFNTCMTTLALGQSCNDSTQCQDGLYCSVHSSTCVAQNALGATCDSSDFTDGNACVSGATCEGGSCVATSSTRTAGQSCERLPCAAGLGCNAQKLCAPCG